MDKRMRYRRISLIQCDIELGEPAINERKLTEMLQSAAEAPEKPDIIVLPEMWNTGYAMDRLTALAERDERCGIRRRMSELAARHQVQIVAGSIAEQRNGKLYNTMYAYNRKGEEIASYSKIHLFRLMEEDKYLEQGKALGRFELEGLSCGGAICYDIRFPELSRSLALQGVHTMFVPAQWPHPRLNHWRSLLIARAIENQMYVAACNRVGDSGSQAFCGHSLIIDPWGEIIAEGGEEEEIVSGVIDLSLVHEVRSRIPVFSDRQPQYYD
ncbi:carbon-nitrogen family hydrolase [Paenibacillus brevis]|uniref:Carbon-nitrogen family hydrolase n=1 Tax=Paenibacillus brevis TaxID=2841508 RepID=A0ABS6FW08_9BACL|nr:carbon-nitrogen family hydrolase [Paenibacillus brevis]MBU5674424.1 carbon-nitrogen family hydrolase [Paenibacillus brevis]